MILPDTPQARRDRDHNGDRKFFDMVKKGAILAAGPKTARKVLEWAEKYGYNVRIRINSHLEEGMIYAIDPREGTGLKWPKLEK